GHVVERQAEQEAGQQPVVVFRHRGGIGKRRFQDQSCDGMVRRGVRRHRAAERATIDVNALRVHIGSGRERRVRGVGGGVQRALRRSPAAAAVPRVVEDQYGGARRLELAYDGPAGADGLSVAVKPEEAGGGWGGWWRFGEVVPYCANLP